jgi:KRAB domain-containing zinc finger protein
LLNRAQIGQAPFLAPQVQQSTPADNNENESVEYKFKTVGGKCKRQRTHFSRREKEDIQNRFKKDVKKCSECAYTTVFSIRLAKHIRKSHVRDIKCELCDYATNIRKSLMMHIKTVHDKIKDFKCKQCTFATSYPANLVIHVKGVHLKVKDFKCELCEYSAVTYQI